MGRDLRWDDNDCMRICLSVCVCTGSVIAILQLAEKKGGEVVREWVA